MTFSGRYIANIIQFAVSQGADLNVLMTLTGKKFEELCDESLRIEAQTYNRIVEEAAKQTGNSLIGLYMGESMNLNAIGLIGQIAQTSRTVREALGFVCEFANLGCQALPMSLTNEKEEVSLSLNPSMLWEQQSPEAVKQTADATLIFTAREFQTLTFQKHPPKRVLLKHKDAGRSDEYERLFGCPVKFGQEQYAIVFEKSHTEEPVVTSNYDLLRLLVQHAEEKLQVLNHEAGFASVVKQSVLKLIKPQFPTIEQVACCLNVSVRSLQRKLKEEETSFKIILEELKYHLAEHYLKNQELTVNEIAYMLDYADGSAFSRSFKRWTGITPQAYRQQKNEPLKSQ